MNKRYATVISAYAPVQEISDEQRKALRQNFKPLAARRLTSLPLLIGELTKNTAPEPADEWLFASEFGGAVSLDKYLGSFPNPSPLHFQNSIHPGPLDLINVIRRLPARQLTPMIGGENLLGNALLAALISPADTVHLVIGEEYSAWASEQSLGSDFTFGAYLKLSQKAEHAMAELVHEPEGNAPTVSTQETAELLAHQKPLTTGLPSGGAIRLQWR
ncbi:hypothetical protein [Cerasicoccus maritimus]|uniref:hypothetical protein n=1 Tax=Cerasicoccus maritimus TaxID=490089 RepID=UPI0028529D44|nr:hypothetical protein [Cerasicoccus maritimus]